MTTTYRELITDLAQQAAVTTLTKAGNTNPTTADIAAATRCALRHLLPILQAGQPELFTALHTELAAGHTNPRPRREPTMAIPDTVSAFLAADTDDRAYALAKAVRCVANAKHQYADLLLVEATTSIRDLCPGVSAVVIQIVEDADGGYVRIESVVVGDRYLHPGFFKPTDDDTAAFTYQTRMNQAEANYGGAWSNITVPNPSLKRWQPKRDPDAEGYDAFDGQDEDLYYEIQLVDIDGIAPAAPVNFAEFNATAHFEPIEDGAVDPAVRIAGMLVRVSLDERGILHIAVTSEDAHDALPSREMGVPIVQFSINNATVFTNDTV